MMKRLERRRAPKPMTFWPLLLCFSSDLCSLSVHCMATFRPSSPPDFIFLVTFYLCSVRCPHFAPSTGEVLVLSHGTFPPSHYLFAPSCPLVSVSITGSLHLYLHILLTLACFIHFQKMNCPEA